MKAGDNPDDIDFPVAAEDSCAGEQSAHSTWYLLAVSLTMMASYDHSPKTISGVALFTMVDCLRHHLRARSMFCGVIQGEDTEKMIAAARRC